MCCSIALGTLWAEVLVGESGRSGYLHGVPEKENSMHPNLFLHEYLMFERHRERQREMAEHKEVDRTQ